MTALLRTVLVPRAPRNLGQDTCPNLSHTPLGHCNPSQKQPVTILSHTTPLGQPKHPRFSLQLQCPNLSPLRGRCASSPRPPHLPDQGPNHNPKGTTMNHPSDTPDMTPVDPRPGHDTTTTNDEREAQDADVLALMRLLAPVVEHRRHYGLNVEDAEVYARTVLTSDWLSARVAAAVAELMPEVGHSAQPPAQVLVDAAWKLRNGYDAGGSNVSVAVATLLDRVAAAIDPAAVTTYEGDRPWPAREVEDLVGEAQLIRSIGATPVRVLEDSEREWFSTHPLAAVAGRPELDVMIAWLAARS